VVRPALATSRLALVSVAVLTHCSERTSIPEVFSDTNATASATAPSPRDGRVVLVTVDGARWQEVFEGSDASLGGGGGVPAADLMPRTHRLVTTRGVAIGAPLPGCGTVHTAGGANMSLPGYQEIFTGRRSSCLDNHCAPVLASVLDQAVDAASIGAWEMLDHAVSGGNSGVFVSAGRRWPADAAVKSPALDALVDAGQRSGPFPGNGEYRPDVATAAIALEYYRLAAPALFHIGLGDTDEFGHRDDYGGYLDALRRADAVIGAVADILDATGAAGAKTSVIVTADHGRNATFRDHGLFHPESGRSFLLAFGGGIPTRGVACPERDITLADITPTIRVLMGLPPDDADGIPIALITSEHG
jgi:hypothetical protein